VVVSATGKLYLDGGTDTYIYEESADDLHVVVGGRALIQIDENINAADGSMAFGTAAAPNENNFFRIVPSAVTLNAAQGVYNIAQVESGTITTAGASEVYSTITGVRIQTFGITLGSGDSATVAAGLYVDAPTGATTNAAIYVASGDIITKGDVGIGANVPVPESPLHVVVSTVARAPHANAVLTLEKSDNAYIQMLTGNTGLEGILFGDTDDVDVGSIWYGHSDNYMGFHTANSERMRLDSAGRVFIGDTANGDATGASLTIKGAGTTPYDTFALKDTEVNHGGGGASIENDTWFKIRRARASDSGGGAYLVAISENVATPDAVFSFLALGNTADTTKTSSASGMYTFRAREHDNANTINDLTANGNHTAFIGRVGDAERALFLIDEDGDYWYDGADGGAFDDDWDAGLIRAAQIATTANPAQIIRTKFDQLVEYDQDALKLRGLLGGAITGSRDEGAINGLLNGAQWNRVFMGAIWQQEVKHMSLAEKVDGLEVELIEAKKQLAAISA